MNIVETPKGIINTKLRKKEHRNLQIWWWWFNALDGEYLVVHLKNAFL